MCSFISTSGDILILLQPATSAQLPPASQVKLDLSGCPSKHWAHDTLTVLLYRVSGSGWPNAYPGLLGTPQSDGKIIEPRHEINCLRAFRPGPTRTELYNHRRWLEASFQEVEGLYYNYDLHQFSLIKQKQQVF